MAEYVIAGNKNPADWTSQVILEKDDDGNVTKSVGRNEPAELSADQRDQLEEQGFILDSVSKTEADDIRQRTAQSGGAGDTAGAAPSFGSVPDQPNQTQDDDE